MKPTQQLHDLGQSLWLDNITREILANGTLRRYIDELSITGLTSNPSIFDHAIKNSNFYDDAILQKMKQGKSGEALFFELAIEDLRQAADLFRPIYDRTNGIDGWVSLEVSPMLAYDTPGTIAEVKQLSARAERPNLFVKIPGTPEGIPAIEECIFAGVPVNVTLLFSHEQYQAAAEAYWRRATHPSGAKSRCLLFGLCIHQPLGQSDDGESSRRVAKRAWDRRRQANLQSLSPTARFGAVAATGECRRPATTIALG